MERVLAERLALGQRYADKGMVEDAIRVFDKAQKIDNNAQIHFQLGCLYADKKQDLAAAEAEFQKVFELDPRHADAMKRLINVLIARDQAGQAVAVLNKLLEVAPENGHQDQLLVDYESASRLRRKTCRPALRWA